MTLPVFLSASQTCDAGGCGSTGCSISIDSSGNIGTGDTSAGAGGGVTLSCSTYPGSGYFCCCYGDEGTWWNPWDNAEIFAPTISSSDLGCDERGSNA